MKLKVIRTGDMDCLMFPEGVTSLDEFVKKNISKDNMFMKMRILSDDAGTEPFFLKEDIKDIYVNFNNVSTLYEDEVFLLTVQEFEENLRPFTDEICDGCLLNGNPETGCDRVINKRDKINIIEGECFLYQEEDDFEGNDEFYEDPYNITLKSKPGKIFKFRKNDDDED